MSAPSCGVGNRLEGERVGEWRRITLILSRTKRGSERRKRPRQKILLFLLVGERNKDPSIGCGIRIMRKWQAQDGSIASFCADLFWSEVTLISCQQHSQDSKVKSGCRSGEIVQRHLLVPSEPPNLSLDASLLKKLPGRTF